MATFHNEESYQWNPTGISVEICAAHLHETSGKGCE